MDVQKALRDYVVARCETDEPTVLVTLADALVDALLSAGGAR